MEKLTRSFFERPPLICARELIGMTFRWKSCTGIVVETEAYAEHGDEACHTFVRPSARQFVAKNAAGTAYVYLNYGMYWLTNVLCKDPESGDCGFVLLRALDPSDGLVAMRKRRNRKLEKDLCSGPGKLSQALGIAGSDHGKNLTAPVRRFRGGFYETGDDSLFEVVADRRIGISKAQELEWRFLMAGNSCVSGPPKNRRDRPDV